LTRINPKRNAPFPRIDVSESDGEIEITAESPGLEQRAIDVSVAMTGRPSAASDD
jgi:HSP20 family molecular chaperone IbpA